jgi:hypothetical protein
MNKDLCARVPEDEPLPLSWAGSSTDMDYLNFGDALSPVMVALLSGRQIRRVPTRSRSLRMAAVGTIGHGFAEGEVWFWGTGCSSWKNPSAPLDERVPFTVPPQSKFVVTATRGPVSEQLLAGPDGHKPGVYGDPVWILPQFYRPQVEKKWKIGAILHLSELKDRSPVAIPRDNIRRFDIPAELADDVHLITTCAPISMQAIGDKIDEILACERIVSTSLHGMVIAESYGIPCLYFAPNGDVIGPAEKPLDPQGDLDLRIIDLYRGLGKSSVMTYVQPRDALTDWPAVMAAVDRHWRPVTLDTQPLIDAFPFPLNPVVPAPGQTIWQHPVLTDLCLQHDVVALRQADARANAVATPPRKAPAPRRFGPQDKQDLLSRLVADHGGVPLSWVASTQGTPYANLGDALSAVVVAALAGVPVRHAHFDKACERLVGVGTIGHAQKNGTLHVWGTGFDATRNAVQPDLGHFIAPPDTAFHVHATRGPRSAGLLREAGLTSGPCAHGDPVWLLPRIWPMADVAKTTDIGVIVHITELDALRPDAPLRAAYRRYDIPETLSGSIRVINTLTEPTLDALKAKVAEIASCRMILSTSLHGLVIAETYGIPCAWFSTEGRGTGTRLDLADDSVKIDHRMRDFYLGAGASHLPTFAQDRQDPTDWQAAADFVMANWAPLDLDAADLVQSFPLPLAPRDAKGQWRLTSRAETDFRF